MWASPRAESLERTAGTAGEPCGLEPRPPPEFVRDEGGRRVAPEHEERALGRGLVEEIDVEPSAREGTGHPVGGLAEPAELLSERHRHQPPAHPHHPDAARPAAPPGRHRIGQNRTRPPRREPEEGLDGKPERAGQPEGHPGRGHRGARLDRGVALAADPREVGEGLLREPPLKPLLAERVDESTGHRSICNAYLTL